MKFLETSKTLNNADLESVEHELGIIFPPEFKEHYLEHNGGYPERSNYIWHNGKTTAIDVFASIKEQGFVNLEEMYRNMVLIEPYLPVGIIPFATDSFGNLFCISSNAKDFGSIYYHNNDHYNITNNQAALTLLDTSFKHFLDNLSE